MQKVEILLEGPDEEACAGLINDLAYVVTQHYQVSVGNVYCGTGSREEGICGPAGAGIHEPLPGPGHRRPAGLPQEGAGSVSRKEQEGHSKGRAEA